MLGGIVAETDPPEHRMFVLPRRDYEIIDTWHATALRGTGSNDVAAEEASSRPPSATSLALA